MEQEYTITFYNIQDDIPIGGFAKVGNEVYKVVGVKGCTLCEFITNRTHCEIARCSTSLRLDKRDVSLILYDTIPEDNDEQPGLSEYDPLEYKSTEARELRLEYLLDSKFEAKLALHSNRNDPRYPEEYVEYKNWLNTLS